MNFKQLANISKALGDETRAKIFCLLKDGSMCACKILEEFKITQPTLSYHMKLLVECGLVEVNKQGIWNFYNINSELSKEFCRFICGKSCEL